MAQRRRSQIPHFDSYQDEAAFWETHSLAEFEDELEIVSDMRVKRPLKHELAVPLDAAALTKLISAGSESGLGPAALARKWILERLAETSTARPVTPPNQRSVKPRAR